MPDDLTIRTAAYDASQQLFRAAQDITSPDVPAAQVPLSALTDSERAELLVCLGDMLPIAIDLLDGDQRQAIGELLHRAGRRQVKRGDDLLPPPAQTIMTHRKFPDVW